MAGLVADRAASVLLRCMAQRRLVLGAAFAAVACGSVLAVGVQWLLKLLIDSMTSVWQGGSAVETILAVFLILVAAENICWRVGGWMGARAVIAVGSDIRLLLFDRLTLQSAQYFNTNTAGALASRIPGTADAVRGLLSTLIWNLVPPLADGIGSVVVIGSISRLLALWLVVAGGATCATTLLLGRRAMPVHQALYAKAAQTAGELVDVIGNVSLLKAFGTRSSERQILARGIASEASLHRRSWGRLEATRAVHDFMLWLAVSVTLVIAVRAWRHGGLTTGSIVVVTTLTFRVLSGSRELALSALGVAQNYSAVREAFAVLTAPVGIADRPDAAKLSVRYGDVSLEDVSFAYGAGPSLLERFSLHIPAGQHLGIVGPSGAGKSTLIRLLQRQEDVAGGAILIDGQRIDGVTQQSLAEGISVVSQEVALLHRSVLENIRYARPDAGMAEVMRAARLAHCAEFIEALPQGYDTLVGERGMALSGGQRQRIAIARAILKDAKIIVFDEATGALDLQLERAVQLALDEWTRGRTVLTIAHRLSGLRTFDRVIVLEHGRIVEDGPPAVLAHQNGLFGRAWRLQADLFPAAACCKQGDVALLRARETV